MVRWHVPQEPSLDKQIPYLSRPNSRIGSLFSIAQAKRHLTPIRNSTEAEYPATSGPEGSPARREEAERAAEKGWVSGALRPPIGGHGYSPLRGLS